jgi:hypothetical protein
MDVPEVRHILSVFTIMLSQDLLSNFKKRQSLYAHFAAGNVGKIFMHSAPAVRDPYEDN